jgi:VWFA-related protein
VRNTLSHRFGIALAIATVAASTMTLPGLAQSGSAQQPPAAMQPVDPQQPTFRTGTNFVRVDVYPTQGGKPVQGLSAADFEVLEDGVRQKIEAFEHVLITPAGPQATRTDPGSQREALQEAANPRSRVFVVFLDTPNVTVEGSHKIKEPIIRLIDTIVGPDDLVGIMTPSMSTSNMVLGRKTQVIEQQLRDNWAWGTRFGLLLDEREQAYHACYPPLPHERSHHSALATQMIARKRERATFEALEDVVRWLHGIREERKAIITVTEGWVRYRPDESLMRLRTSGTYTEEPPGREVIGVGPTGKLTTKPTNEIDPDLLSKRECDTDRMRLAMMDNDQFFRQIVDDANRGNASFYPIDPRGLPAFDSPIGPDAPPPVSIDHAILRERLESMHDLALATDGIAVVNNNDLDLGLRRIADDLTSYYLLGYYSTNPKLDGRFRRLEVKVNQPGVAVRSRRGYRMPTEEEVAAAKAASEPAAVSKPSAFTAAMDMLSRIRPDARFRINAATQQTSAGKTLVWVAGEVLGRSASPNEVAGGGTADIEISAGGSSATTRVMLKPGERTFLTLMELASTDASEVQVRARLSSEDSAVPVTDSIQAETGPAAAQPLLYRRGPSTANKVVPAADFSFSRSERLRLEVPVGNAVKPGDGRLLDRTGQPLKVPVTVAERVDQESGQRWITADVTLAPLAAGDYAVELTTSSGSDTKHVITAFRVRR